MNVKAQDGKTGQRVRDDGVIVGGPGQLSTVARDFIRAIAQHRHWSRESKGQQVPA